ncbi:MAG: efflux RND transporter periplasmic adaptor subunit, partial [Planctomycetota bacterium]
MSIDTSMGAAPASAVVGVTKNTQREWTELPNLNELANELSELRERFEDNAHYLSAAARCIASHQGAVAVSLRGRVGAKSLNDFAASGELSDEQREELQQAAETALLDNHGESGIFLHGPLNVADRNIQLISLGFAQDSVAATLTFATKDAGEHVTRILSTELQFAVSVLLQELGASAGAEQKQQTSQNLDATELAARVAKYSDTREFAFALAHNLAERFDCQQVSFGVRKRRNIEVLAVSGKDSFKASAPGIVDIQQAMEETLDAGQLCSYQPFGQSEAHNPMPVHTQWGSQTNRAVLSIPLMIEEDCVAVVSLTREPNHGFSQAEVAEFTELLAPFGPAVDMSLRGSRSLREHMRTRAGDALQVAKQPKTRTGQVLRVGIVAAVLFFFFGWLPFAPTTPCSIVPTNLTQTLTPFSMQLKEVLVHSGDEVVAGQPLVVFDSREFLLEKERILALRDQAEVDVRAALLKGDAASASLAQANVAAQEAQLETVQRKIDLCTIVAPSDGMIVEADLNKKIGQVLPQGTQVLSFAPMDQFELEIRIPEYNARHITTSQAGTFVSTADPSKQIDFTIDHVAGSAKLVDGK